MQITVGQKAHREAKVTREMVRSYAEITWDFNPLHFDTEFTGRTRCDGRARTRLRIHEPELDIPRARLYR